VNNFADLRMVPPTPGMLQQQLEQFDEKHESGHIRLRHDVRQLERDVEEVKRQVELIALAQAQAAAKPVDLETVRVSPKFAAAIITAVLTIVASDVGSVWVLRSDLRDMGTKMDGVSRFQTSQIDALQKSYESVLREQAMERVRLEETRNALSKIEGLLTNVRGARK
jgi:hypothetical protein